MIRNLLAKPALVASLVIVAGICFHVLAILSVAPNGMRGPATTQTPGAFQQFDPSGQNAGLTAAQPSAENEPAGVASSQSAQNSVAQFNNEVAGRSAPSSESQSFNPQQAVTAAPAQHAPAGYTVPPVDPNYVNGRFDHAARVHAQTAASVTAWAQSNVHRWDNFNQETDRIPRGQSVWKTPTPASGPRLGSVRSSRFWMPAGATG